MNELDRDSWDRIACVFDRALDVAVAGRAALLDQLCGSDLTVRQEVEEMLHAHENNEDLLIERRLVEDGRGAISLADPLAAGTRVGPYRITSLIGVGGMGDVYRAERADGVYRQTVALKVLRPGYRTAEMVRRFRVESEALARLAHPGIAAILDGGALDDGRPYIVLQFVDGTPIDAYCDAYALGIRERLALVLDVARTVQFAHGRLVVHRDIKPSNILVQRDGAPRLLDFGIAKLLDIGSDASLAVDTTPDLRLLTLAYAAPEQLRGEPPTTATDVYALGALLFELLTGAKPFTAAARTVWTLERAILDTPAPPPSRVVSSPTSARRLRGDLDHIVLMALRKDPERRYVSAAQFADDLERYLAGRPVIARPDSVRYRSAKFIARNRAFVAGVTGVVLLLTAFAVTATLQARRISRERDRAERERIAAEDVIGILTGLFERADPNKHPGGDTLRVTALLDEAERKVATLHDDPVREAALWQVVGRMRAARGELVRAIELLTRAYEGRRAVFGADDIEAARIRHEIALVRSLYEGVAATRPMLAASLEELRRLEGDDDADVRTAISDLLMATSDTGAARMLLARLLELERRLPSRDPIAVADRLDARAAERYAAGSYSEAASLWQAALDILVRQLPPEHEIMGTERRNLALALYSDGQLARAESLQRAELALEQRLRGSSITRGMAEEALAMTLVAEGRADSAEARERDALALFRSGTAPGHTRTWSAARNLGFIVASRGRAEEGLALLDTAIAIAAVGADSGPPVGYLMAQRIPFLLQRHRVRDASSSLDSAERRLGAAASVNAQHRADVERYAGMIALAARHPTDAVTRFRSAVALTESPGKLVRDIDSCLLGVGLVELGRMAEARPYLDGPCSTYKTHGLPSPLIVDWIAAARARTLATR